MCQLMVLLATGIDEALQADPDPILSVVPTNTDDVISFGMECPDAIYTRATMRGNEVLPALRKSGHCAVCESVDDE
jgi:hypothetical protein